MFFYCSMKAVMGGRTPCASIWAATCGGATVRTHLEHIYTKLDIHSARELMTSNLDEFADGRTH